MDSLDNYKILSERMNVLTIYLPFRKIGIASDLRKVKTAVCGILGMASHLLSLLLWQSEIRKTFADTMSAGESSVPKSGAKLPSNLRSARNKN